MAEASTRKLEEFSFDHLTYINQIFGDQTVREAIAAEFLNHRTCPKIQFIVEYDRDEFEEGIHHVVDLGAGEIWCSVNTEPFQDIAINVNDTLCQSYTLLKAFGGLDGRVPEPGGRARHKEVQLLMIQLYRYLVGYERTWFRELLMDLELRTWVDFKDNERPFAETASQVDEIIGNIHNVLTEWEEYGHLYFTGAGTGTTTMTFRSAF